MSGLIGEGVSLRGIYDENWSLTWNLSGAATRADVGKVVCQDTTAANTAKLTVADAQPLGVLQSYENRTVEGVVVGAISMKGIFAVPYTGTLLVGASVVGSATAGAVKSATAGSNRTVVVEVNTTTLMATVAFL